MNKLIIAFLISTVPLYPNWEEHVRSCLDKGNGHSVPGVDFIYMINLKKRPEKWDTSLQQLRPYGIFPYRFEAIDAWEMDPELLKQMGCPDFAVGMTPGRIGCVLSHLSVLKDAFDSGYGTIWVMEDDIEIVRNPLQIEGMLESLDALMPDWDILFTDPESKNEAGQRIPCTAIHPRPNFQHRELEWYLRRNLINDTFLEIGMRYGTYSMIIRRSGMEKILDYFTKYRLYLPIDMELFLVPGLKQVVIRRDFVTSRVGAISDTTTNQ